MLTANGNPDKSSHCRIAWTFCKENCPILFTPTVLIQELMSYFVHEHFVFECGSNFVLHCIILIRVSRWSVLVFFLFRHVCIFPHLGNTVHAVKLNSVNWHKLCMRACHFQSFQCWNATNEWTKCFFFTKVLYFLCIWCNRKCCKTDAKVYTPERHYSRDSWTCVVFKFLQSWAQNLFPIFDSENTRMQMFIFCSHSVASSDLAQRKLC